MVDPLLIGLEEMTTAFPSLPTLTVAMTLVTVFDPTLTFWVMVKFLPAYLVPTFNVMAVFPEDDLTADTIGFVTLGAALAEGELAMPGARKSRSEIAKLIDFLFVPLLRNIDNPRVSELGQ